MTDYEIYNFEAFKKQIHDDERPVPRDRREIAEYMGIKTLFYVMKKYIQPLVDNGLLKMTMPDKPKSKNQKFYTEII